MYIQCRAFCCRHTTGYAGLAAVAQPFGGRQRDAQPSAVAVPPEPVDRTVAQTLSAVADAAADDEIQPIADAHASDESQVAGRRERPEAGVVHAGPEQHVERGRRPAVDGQAAAAAVRGHVLPTGGRHHQPVGRDAEPAEGFESRFADRHPDTGARAKDLSPSAAGLLSSLLSLTIWQLSLEYYYRRLSRRRAIPITYYHHGTSLTVQ